MQLQRKSEVLSIIFLVFQLFLEAESTECNSNITITRDLIESTGAKIATDPAGAGKAFKSFVCVSPCTIDQSLHFSKIAFNLVLIDVQLLAAEAEKSGAEILTKHLNNTNPILATSLLIFLDSFLQGSVKLSLSLCKSLNSVDKSLSKASLIIQDLISDSQSTILALQTCADDNHVYVKDDISMQYNICLRKSLNVFNVEFNKYLGFLATYKFFFPDLLLQFANCLIKDESNSDLLVALETSRCLGYGEKIRFKEFYDIINEALERSLETSIKLQYTINSIRKCGQYYVQKFYDVINQEKIVCNLYT